MDTDFPFLNNICIFGDFSNRRRLLDTDSVLFIIWVCLGGFFEPPEASAHRFGPFLIIYVFFCFFEPPEAYGHIYIYIYDFRYF